MFDVEVENFQSIEKASLRVDGYTALVGRSNIGKSALIRAMKCALTGALGTDFVRHGPRCLRRAKGTKKGSKKCSCSTKVTIKMDNLVVLWEKGDEVNRYEITRDGVTQEYSALERGDHEFLQPDFRRITIGDSKELLQVSDQFEPLFLLNVRGSAVADVLSDVAQLDEINGAIRLVGKDKREASSTRTVREKDANDLRSQLAAFDGVDLVEARVGQLEARFTASEDLRDRLAQVDSFIGRLATAETEVSRLRGVATVQVPGAEALLHKGVELARIVDFLQALVLLKGVILPLAAVAKLVVPDSEALRAKGQTFALLDRFYDQYAEKAPAVERLEGVDRVVVPNATSLSQKAQALTSLDDWVRRMQGIKASVEKLRVAQGVAVPDAEALRVAHTRASQLSGFVTKMDSLTKGVSDLEERLRASSTERDAAQQELDALGVCPTCSQDIGQSHQEHD